MRLQEIFNHIETKIKTITHIQGVEWFTDQERSKEGISAAPCRVFIEIAPTPVEKINRYTQKVEYNITVHIYTKFAKANVKLKERPLHEAIHISVIKKLHYYDLTSETPYQKIRGLHKTTCSFTRTIVGDAAKRHQNTSDTSELTPNIT